MRRKNTLYKATALAMTSVLTLGAPVIAHAENTEGTDLSDEGYPEINPEIAALENQELEIWLPADQGQDPNFQTVKKNSRKVIQTLLSIIILPFHGKKCHPK